MSQSTTTLVLGILGAVSALLVTAHVLLNKRDVAASIGWIGLAWLSPLIGSILYGIFGINRVKRRADPVRVARTTIRMGGKPRGSASRDDHFAGLLAMAGRVTGRAAEEGNSVTLLRNGDEAYPKMIAAIEKAQSSIALSSYIFRADSAGNPFIDALARAHQRGVAVRVIVDGVGSGYILSPAYQALRRKGVPVYRFLHSLLPWRMPVLNLRTHKKLLSIDGRLAFTGGLNIGAENLVAEQPPHPVRDTHFFFEGPVITQLNEAFAEDWLFVSGELLSGEAWFPTLAKVGDATARAITSGPDQDLDKIELIILQAIASARRSVKIMTPYFLSDDRLTTALSLAAMRGVEVDVILPEKNNHFLVGWAMGAQIVPLVIAGCRIWRNQPPFEHSKVMTVDRSWCLLGSANWDMRSFRLNFELNVEVYHDDIARDADAFMTTKQTHRVTIEELSRRPLSLRLRDNGARLLLPYL